MEEEDQAIEKIQFNVLMDQLAIQWGVFLALAHAISLQKNIDRKKLYNDIDGMATFHSVTLNDIERPKFAARIKNLLNIISLRDR